MPGIRLALSLSVALTFLTPAKHVEAQLGGLIKKKAADAVKGTDKKEQAAEKDQPATSPGDSKLPMKLTENVLAAFTRGLEVELDNRRATVKRLASLKTSEAYNTCQQTLASSPEVQKIIMSPADLPSSATVEQVQKAMEKVQTDVAKLLVEKCGEDPRSLQGGWRQQQIVAAEAAGIKTFSAALGTGSTGSRQQHFAAEVTDLETFGTALGTASSGTWPYILSEQGQQGDADFYRLLKEWIPVFCNLSTAQQLAAADRGVAIPGTGAGIAYVYTALEAHLLIPACPSIMMLLRDIS